MEGSQASAVCPSDKSNMKMNTEHWWNKSDRTKTKYLEKKYLSQCQSVHHKSNMVRPGVDTSVYNTYRFSSHFTENTVPLLERSVDECCTEKLCVFVATRGKHKYTVWATQTINAKPDSTYTNH